MVERRPFKGELWCVPQIPANVVVNILMPNGLILEVSCCREDSLEKIKRSAWNRAEKEILYRLLGDITCYIFIGVTQDAEIEEFYDENRRLCDLNLFTTLLKLAEPQGDKEEKRADSEISMTIGVPLSELDSHPDNEVHHFRREISNFCKDVVEKREKAPIDAKLYYDYQPHLDEASSDENRSSRDLMLDICVWFIDDKSKAKILIAKAIIFFHYFLVKMLESPSDHESKNSVQISVSLNVTSSQVINQALKKFFDNHGGKLEDPEKMSSVENKFVLKACGIEEYLLGDHPLHRYKVRMHLLAHSVQHDR